MNQRARDVGLLCGGDARTNIRRGDDARKSAAEYILPVGTASSSSLAVVRDTGGFEFLATGTLLFHGEGEGKRRNLKGEIYVHLVEGLGNPFVSFAVMGETKSNGIYGPRSGSGGNN
jgi:hypothetical protein